MRSSFAKCTFLGIGISIIVLSMAMLGSGIAIVASLCPALRRTSDSCSVVFRELGIIFIAPAVLNVITGSLGISAACSDVGHRIAGLKNGFMVMCILSALSSVSFGYVYISYLAPVDVDDISDLTGTDATLYGGLVTGVISTVVIFLLSVVGASISCCCSPVYQQ